ncbi:MAG: hypothetical protein LBT14_08445 [Treponema sp.]|nr:hypothetical protein [Treponema sp.]
MKHFACVILGLPLLMISCTDDVGEKNSLIAELPNTTEYGISVDIGIVYKRAMEDAIIYNYDKRWCLFSGNSYWIFMRTFHLLFAPSGGPLFMNS